MRATPAEQAESLRGATLYLDCFSGLAGDMTLAALLDLGVPESVVRDALAKLALPPFELKIFDTMKGALRAKKVEVLEHAPGHEPGHEPGPTHEHRHEPKHEPVSRPTHVHSHEHSHGRAHLHEHRHEHRNEHLHRHTHEHSHDHEHGHGHEHPHEPQHGHEHPHSHVHVHYSQIRQMLERAGLEADVLARALWMFDRIAEVEARLHGVSVADVAFHEVGALDSIVDLVGVAAALAWLRPHRVVSRAVPVGGGTVWTAHGRLPVPAPATLALLSGCGAPIEPGGAEVELTTPTGAAIVAASVTAYGSVPAMKVLAVGHGAGTRELPDRPNLLRIVAGTEALTETTGTGAAAPAERCTVIEANIDDMSPQLFEPLLEGLLAAGARDVWLTPVHMKKGRPGVIVGVLCDPAQRPALSALLLRESTTIGVRTHEVERSILDRAQVWVPTPYGAVAVKIARDPQSGEVWNVAPEYEVCRERARAAGVPVKEVVAAALVAYHRKP